MTSSDDEFDDPYDYNEELEAELQRLEKETGPIQEGNETKRNKVDIAYEPEAKPLIPGTPADLSDMQPAPSQNSTFEEELVDQVTSLLVPITRASHDTTTEDNSQPIPVPSDHDAFVPEATQLVQDTRSLFQRFRKREFFSVSDLVGPLWCEVQYDYRLRSKPYLKAEERPDIIVTREGKHIPLDKVKAVDHDKTMKRGEVVHKKLEKEIHPVEVKVTTTSREDVWGLRFLNMLSSLQALLDIGKCRELPVVGFVHGYMVVGVIDELVLEKLPTTKETTMDTPERKSQRLLTSFFSSNPSSRAEAVGRRRTHRLLLSDSKTRASGTLPKVENAKSGMSQLMCYKEILDNMLLVSNDRRASIAEGSSWSASSELQKSRTGSPADPIPVQEDGLEPDVSSTEDNDVQRKLPVDLSIDHEQPFDQFSWHLLFRHLHLDPNASLSDGFLSESRTVMYGNGLENRLYDGKCLWDYVDCWVDYVRRLGLGAPGVNGDSNGGKSEDRLELVYRNVRTTAHRKGKKRRSGETDEVQRNNPSHDPIDPQVQIDSAPVANLQSQEEARLLALAIEESLKQTTLDEGLLPDADGVSALQAAPDLERSAGARSPPTLATEDSGPVERELRDVLAAAEIVQSNMISASLEANLAETLDATIESSSSQPKKTAKRKRPKDGSIIGTHVFHHDRSQLSNNLEKVLHFWMSVRQPEGVGIEHVSRCGWCEFEEGCEWRDQKAKEAVTKHRAQMKRE